MNNQKPDKSSKKEAQRERTRLNKIRRIEKELKKHPKMENNKLMMRRLEELKSKK